GDCAANYRLASASLYEKAEDGENEDHANDLIEPHVDHLNLQNLLENLDLLVVVVAELFVLLDLSNDPIPEVVLLEPPNLLLELKHQILHGLGRAVCGPALPGGLWFIDVAQVVSCFH